MVDVATDRAGGWAVDFRKVPGSGQPLPDPGGMSSPDQKPSHEQFAAVVGPLQRQLVRLAKRILRCNDLDQDAVQEALLSLWLAGRLPPNPAAWLTRAVVLRSLHLNRSRIRRRTHEEHVAFAHGFVAGVAAHPPAATHQADDLQIVAAVSFDLGHRAVEER